LQLPNELKATIVISRVDQVALGNFIKAFIEAEHTVKGSENLVLTDSFKGCSELASKIKQALDQAAIDAAEKTLTKRKVSKKK